VEGNILDKSKKLGRRKVTVSLLEVLLSKPRKMFRYDINCYPNIISCLYTVLQIYTQTQSIKEQWSIMVKMRENLQLLRDGGP